MVKPITYHFPVQVNPVQVVNGLYLILNLYVDCLFEPVPH